MKNRLIAMLLCVATLLSLLGTSVIAASSTEEGALGEVKIFNGNYPMNYLCMNGSPKVQEYTYFNYKSSDGNTQEIPAYCINPVRLVPGQSA